LPDTEDKGCDVTPDEAAYGAIVTTCGMASGKHNTMCLARRCIEQNIPGDFVECGVHAGGHPALMSFINAKYGGNRMVHLFDSWEGMPVGSPDDTEFDRKILGVNPDRLHGRAANWFIATIEQTRHNMKAWRVDETRLVYHKGWLQDVLPIVAPTMGPIALLRIDVDLYDSTVPVIKYLYPKVSSGGYIISDDYGESEAAIPARLALLKTLGELGVEPPKVMRINDTPGTVWWRKP